MVASDRKAWDNGYMEEWSKDGEETDRGMASHLELEDKGGDNLASLFGSPCGAEVEGEARGWLI